MGSGRILCSSVNRSALFIICTVSIGGVEKNSGNLVTLFGSHLSGNLHYATTPRNKCIILYRYLYCTCNNVEHVKWSVPTWTVITKLHAAIRDAIVLPIYSNNGGRDRVFWRSPTTTTWSIYFSHSSLFWSTDDESAAPDSSRLNNSGRSSNLGTANIEGYCQGFKEETSEKIKSTLSSLRKLSHFWVQLEGEGGGLYPLVIPWHNHAVD